MKAAFILQIMTVPLWYPLMAMWYMRDEAIGTIRDSWNEVKQP
jgi:hypothetical protein